MPGFAKPIDQQGQEEVWKALGRHLKTTLFGEPSTLPYSASNKYSRDLNPVEAFDKEKNPEGAIFAQPGLYWQEAQIRGVAKPAARFLRKIMQSEFKARGPHPVAGRPAEEMTADEIYSKILRGPWFRGQEETPKIVGMSDIATPRIAHRGQRWTGRTDLRTEEPGIGNVGEPRGISLSYDPAVSRHFAKENLQEYPGRALANKASHLDYKAGKIADKVDAALAKIPGETEVPESVVAQTFKAKKYYDIAAKLRDKARELPASIGDRKKINRMLPMFEGAPEQNVLIATKPEHGKILNDAYTKAANRMLELYPKLRKEVIKGRKFYEALEKATPQFTKDFDDIHPVRQFNELLTEELQSQGYKGLLHSPHRYSEYELRMFDPKDVIHLDKRRAPTAKSEGFSYHKPWEEKSSVARLRDAKVPLQEEHTAMTKDKTGAHLYEWYNQIPEEALAGKWAKPRDRYLNRQQEKEMSILDDLAHDIAGPPTLSVKGKKAADAINEKMLGGPVVENIPGKKQYYAIPEYDYTKMKGADKAAFEGAVEIWDDPLKQTESFFDKYPQNPKVIKYLDEFAQKEYGVPFKALIVSEP